ncbi:hypothetical protein AVEN_152526-1, partial [Araneus ventricosus]
HNHRKPKNHSKENTIFIVTPHTQESHGIYELQDDTSNEPPRNNKKMASHENDNKGITLYTEGRQEENAAYDIRKQGRSLPPYQEEDSKQQYTT